MAVLFPDIEKTVVAFLKEAIVGTDYEGARVATKKALPDETQPALQLVAMANYQAEENYVLKSASLLLEVWADDYATANAFSLWVEAKVRDIVGHPIKQATVLLGPVRDADETRQEVRRLDVELLVKGSTI